MKFGVSLPNTDAYSDPHLLVELAVLAEESGWDGVFLWDSLYIEGKDGQGIPAADPWVALAAMATATTRVRLGPYVAPLARRRPWKVAREVVTLDQLTRGRALLPTGYGSTSDGGFARVGEEMGGRARADAVDEALQILTGLWAGERFGFAGSRYTMQPMQFLPRPMQQPRVPIWLDASWPVPRSMRRAMRFDGIIPSSRDADGTWRAMMPDDFAAMMRWIEKERTETTPFDVVREGDTPGDNPAAATLVRPFAESGVTWWIEAVWTHFYRGTVESMKARIAQGPPQL